MLSFRSFNAVLGKYALGDFLFVLAKLACINGTYSFLKTN